MIVKLLTEHHLEFLSFEGGCTGLSESTHVKMSIVGNIMSRLNYYKPELLAPAIIIHSNTELVSVDPQVLSKTHFSIIDLLQVYSTHCL